MTTQHSNTKRWRPRFSVRTLVIVVTLVCVYLAGQKITQRSCETDEFVPVPLVIARNCWIVRCFETRDDGQRIWLESEPHYRIYYLAVGSWRWRLSRQYNTR